MIKSKLKNFSSTLLKKLSPRIYIRASYIYNRHKLPNLKNPKNLSEIILSSMDTGEIIKYTDYVDKIKVREILSAWGYSAYLTELYGVWEHFDHIDIKNLPQSFALKTNHGCGSHYICKNKSTFNVSHARQILNEAMGKNFGKIEPQYRYVNPRIYCEEYIDDGSGDLPIDYKFHCFNGDIKCILVVSERKEGSYKRQVYNRNWESMPHYINPKFKSDFEIDQPLNLNLMIHIATDIAKKFEFVRVDFYDLGDRVIIGELTFSPQGGIMNTFTMSALEEMSSRIHMPSKAKI